MNPGNVIDDMYTTLESRHQFRKLQRITPMRRFESLFRELELYIIDPRNLRSEPSTRE